MKALILGFLVLLTSACATDQRYYTKPDATPVAVEGFSSLSRIEKVGECEYIKQYTTHSYTIYTHKGDCKNPFHKEVIKEAIRELNAEQNRNQRTGN